MENELVSDIKKLVIRKQLNFLIGSGASLPAIPLMGMIKENSEKKRNNVLQNIVKEISKIITNNTYYNKNILE